MKVCERRLLELQISRSQTLSETRRRFQFEPKLSSRTSSCCCMSTLDGDGVSLLTLPSRSPPEACCYCRDSLILTQLVLRFLLCSCFSVSLSFCFLPSHQSHGKADCTLFVVCRYRLGVSGVRLFVTSTYL